MRIWRLLAAVDEWFHRRGMGLVNGHAYGAWRFTPFPALCNLRQRHLNKTWEAA